MLLMPWEGHPLGRTLPVQFDPRLLVLSARLKLSVNDSPIAARILQTFFTNEPVTATAVAVNAWSLVFAAAIVPVTTTAVAVTDCETTSAGLKVAICATHGLALVPVAVTF